MQKFGGSDQNEVLNGGSEKFGVLWYEKWQFYDNFFSSCCAISPLKGKPFVTTK